MGGSSKASTSATTTTRTNTQTRADYSQGEGTRIAPTTNGNGNYVTVNALDAGAVSGGLAVAKDSIVAMGQSSEKALNFGRDALSFADASGQRAADALKSSVSTVANLAASQEAGNRDSLKMLSDFATNIRTDGQQQTAKLIQNIALAIVVAVTVIAGAIAWSNHKGAKA